MKPYIDYDLEKLKRKDVLKCIGQELRDIKNQRDSYYDLANTLRNTLYMCEKLYNLNFEDYCKENFKCFSALYSKDKPPMIKYNNKIIDMNELKNVTISYTKTDDGKWITELTTTK